MYIESLMWSTAVTFIVAMGTTKGSATIRKAVCVMLLCAVSAVRSSTRRKMDRFAYFEKIGANISWTISMETQYLFVELIAPVSSSNAWMAFGISDTGGMKGADIGLISLFHGRIFDLHAFDFILPRMDKVQNYELLYLQQKN